LADRQVAERVRRKLSALQHTEIYKTHLHPVSSFTVNSVFSKALLREFQTAPHSKPAQTVRVLWRRRAKTAQDQMGGSNVKD
jgi:hypothetical protein